MQVLKPVNRRHCYSRFNKSDLKPDELMDLNLITLYLELRPNGVSVSLCQLPISLAKTKKNRTSRDLGDGGLAGNTGIEVFGNEG